jgi:hypothetical protein
MYVRSNIAMTVAAVLSLVSSQGCGERRPGGDEKTPVGQQLLSLDSEQAQSLPPTPADALNPPSGTRSRVYLMPDHRSTLTDTTPIRLVFDALDVSRDLMDQLSREVELTLFPSGEPVAFSLVVYKSSGTLTSGPVEEIPKPYIEVQPQADLADSWHALRVRSVPTGITIAAWSARRSDRGGFESIFHPRSQPVFKRFYVCQQGPKSFRATLELSENMAPETSSDAIAALQADGTDCKTTGNPHPSPKLLEFDCDGSAPRSWTSLVHRHPRGASGVHVAADSPLPQVHGLIGDEQLGESYGHCREFRP